MQNSIDIIQHRVVNYIYKRGIERDASQRKEEALKIQTNQIELATKLLETNSRRDKQPQPKTCNGQATAR
jgi:hypothetical protein